MSTLDELRKEYFALAHAMQSGVAMESDMTSGSPSDMTPKHLRVGVNVCMSDHGGLVKLLVDKGLITDEEYFTYMRDSMKREVESYEKRLSDRFGRTIRLG